MQRPLLVAALTIACCGCSSEPQPEPAPASSPAASQPAAPEAEKETAKEPAPPEPAPLPAEPGQVVFTPQPGWTVETPSSRMRRAQLKLPGGLQLVVYHFGKGRGGTVEANMSRWIAQLEQPGGASSADAAKRTTLTPNGLTVHRLDLSGTYVAAVRPGATERHAKPDQRLLAAVVVGGDGPHFVKLIGPAAAVAAQEASFDAFLEALRVAD